MKTWLFAFLSVIAAIVLAISISGCDKDEIGYTIDNNVVMKGSTEKYTLRVYWISCYTTGSDVQEEYFNGK